MGFSWLLLITCITCGTFWLGWKYQVRNLSIAMPLWVDLSRTIFLVFLFLLLARSFVLEPYRVPSESMMPTLLSGDYIVVQKFCYGLRWPILNSEFLSTGLPQRGDVIAFRKPGDESQHYVKRVIGLPGDRLFYRNKVLRINGENVSLTFVDDVNGESGDGQIEALEQIGTNKHRVIHQVLASPGTGEFEKTIPEAHYFVLGDNRDNSQDSRDPQVGLVPYANLVGKASRVWMNWHELSRAGTKIQ
ncbi:MAG: signal peptidase I [Gammaproteobacteria bacterium]